MRQVTKENAETLPATLAARGSAHKSPRSCTYQEKDDENEDRHAQLGKARCEGIDDMLPGSPCPREIDVHWNLGPSARILGALQAWVLPSIASLSLGKIIG